jgi:hypothetical protein
MDGSRRVEEGFTPHLALSPRHLAISQCVLPRSNG